MRCLPPTPFPMSKKPFPLSYPLPVDRKAIATAAASNRQQANSSLLSRTLRNSLTKSPQKYSVKSSPNKSIIDKSVDAGDSALDDASPSSGKFGFSFIKSLDEILKFRWRWRRWRRWLVVVFQFSIKPNFTNVRKRWYWRCGNVDSSFGRG